MRAGRRELLHLMMRSVRRQRAQDVLRRSKKRMVQMKADRTFSASLMVVAPMD
jgi:hypothetical protein